MLMLPEILGLIRPHGPDPARDLVETIDSGGRATADYLLR